MKKLKYILWKVDISDTNRHFVFLVTFTGTHLRMQF